jgi:hypothetical protein
MSDLSPEEEFAAELHGDTAAEFATSKPMTLLDHALAARARGFYVYPARPMDKTPRLDELPPVGVFSVYVVGSAPCSCSSRVRTASPSLAGLPSMAGLTSVSRRMTASVPSPNLLSNTETLLSGCSRQYSVIFCVSRVAQCCQASCVPHTAPRTPRSQHGRPRHRHALADPRGGLQTASRRVRRCK